MTRRLVILTLLFVLVFAGVELWYGRLRQQLVSTPGQDEEKVAAVKKMPSVRQRPAVRTTADSRKTASAPSLAGNAGDKTYQVIVERNIFGAVLEQEAVAKEEKKAVEPEPEKTTLKLTLLGTVSGNERDARAIIVDEKEKKQDIYQIGDAVQGALISKIKRGKVILDVDGRRQFLVIKERKEGGRIQARTVSNRDFSGPPSIPIRTVPAVEQPVPSVKPHRRISFRQRRKEVLPVPGMDGPAENREQGPDMGDMSGQDTAVE